MTGTQSIARSGSITFIGQILKLVIHLLGLVLLARLLEPADFGLMAMVSIFLVLSQLLRDAGLPMASLQAPTLSKAQSSNMFWLNSLSGLALGMLLWAASPLVVVLFGEPRLQEILPPLAAVVLLNGVQAQIQVQLARAHKFNQLVISELSAHVFSIGCAIAAAMTGLGVWALVILQIAYALALLIMRWVLSRFRVLRPRRNTDTRPLLVSSLHLGGAQLFNWAATSVDSLAVGVASGPTALGLYDRSVQLLSGPMGTILNALTQVVVPGARRAQQNGVPYELSLRRIQSVFGVFLFWVFLSATLTAPALIPILLGDDWSGMVLLFQIISIGGCFRLLGFSSFWSFLLTSASREQFRYALVSRTIFVILIIGGAFFGVIGVAVAYTLGLASNWLIGTVWVAVRIDISIRKIALNGFYYLVVGAVSLSIASVSTWLLNFDSQVTAALIGLSVLTSVFFGFHALSPVGRGAFLEARTILSQVTRKAG